MNNYIEFATMHLNCKNNMSDKFYQITIDSVTNEDKFFLRVVAKYGRSGSNGATTVKQLTEIKSELLFDQSGITPFIISTVKEVEKMKRQKFNKGYFICSSEDFDSKVLAKKILAAMTDFFGGAQDGANKPVKTLAFSEEQVSEWVPGTRQLAAACINLDF